MKLLIERDLLSNVYHLLYDPHNFTRTEKLNILGKVHDILESPHVGDKEALQKELEKLS